MFVSTLLNYRCLLNFQNLMHYIEEFSIICELTFAKVMCVRLIT